MRIIKLKLDKTYLKPSVFSKMYVTSPSLPNKRRKNPLF